MLKRLWVWFEKRVWVWVKTLLYGLVAIYTGIALCGYALQKGIINF